MSIQDIKTLIIGKQSNLSQALLKKNNAFVLLSAREIIENMDILLPFRDSSVRLIFNNFQQSVELGNVAHYEGYIQNAILSTAKVLDWFVPQQIDKIIYTSSSAVYGSNRFCKEEDPLQVLSFHASMKIANEKLIEEYAKRYQIDYTIIRIFNMYGGEDKFSVISKIIHAVVTQKALLTVNGGCAIRDFIHINDVVESYIKILEFKALPIVNIGTGKGNSVKNILAFLSDNGVEVQTKDIQREEIQLSTANNQLLRHKVGVKKFIPVESYLKKRLGL